MRIKRSSICFYLSFACLYVSLFLGDVYDIGGISSFARSLRFCSYGLILLQTFSFKFHLKELFQFVLIFIATLGFGVLTGDLYWSVLVLLIYTAKDIPDNTILKTSITILSIGLTVVLFCCAIGILPDEMTARNPNISNSFIRHSFGFYHSNVLPLLVLYLESYYVFTKREKVKCSGLLLFTIVALILNLTNDSRNALYLSLILNGLVLFEKVLGFQRISKEILYLITKYSVLVMSIFSYAMMYLLLMGGIWDTIDTFFSGRFRLGIFKIRLVGIHFINIMSNEAFFADGITLDNGYIYIILRYGLLFILFYILIAFFLVQKTQGDIYALISLLIIFVANFVDNDLVDYSFLPFILLAFHTFEISNQHIKSILSRLVRRRR